jgi:hypothetical protein
MEIPLLLGRGIEQRNVSAATKVAVVNEVFVKTYFAGQNPIGKHFTLGRGQNAFDIEIQGVAADSPGIRTSHIVEPDERVHVGVQRTRADTPVQSHREARRFSASRTGVGRQRWGD